MRPLVTYTAIGFFFRKEKIRLFLIFFFCFCCPSSHCVIIGFVFESFSNKRVGCLPNLNGGKDELFIHRRGVMAITTI